MSSIFSRGVAGMGSKPAKHNWGFNGMSARVQIRKIGHFVLQDPAPVGKRTALGAGLGTMLFTRPSTGWEDEPITRRKPSMLLRVSFVRSACIPQGCKKELNGRERTSSFLSSELHVPDSQLVHSCRIYGPSAQGANVVHK